MESHELFSPRSGARLGFALSTANGNSSLFFFLQIIPLHSSLDGRTEAKTNDIALSLRLGDPEYGNVFLMTGDNDGIHF